MANFLSQVPSKMTFHFENDLKTQKWPHKWKLCPQNIEKVVLHMVLVQTGAAVYYSLLLVAAILDFVRTGL